MKKVVGAVFLLAACSAEDGDYLTTADLGDKEERLLQFGSDAAWAFEPDIPEEAATLEILFQHYEGGEPVRDTDQIGAVGVDFEWESVEEIYLSAAGLTGEGPVHMDIQFDRGGGEFTASRFSSGDIEPVSGVSGVGGNGREIRMEEPIWLYAAHSGSSAAGDFLAPANVERMIEEEDRVLILGIQFTGEPLGEEEDV
ncbi:hypothetical protein [Alkalicoccus urumqiensis]|uniref:Uncharacterized protein n=1 Tax=Alkalicoccus urumqiensis TaxID=1548213 RepID=A0A2P6MJ80_ALKUR|nr:hypothetical protein [Alkalicoccus urumqiensis]PRO66338.1 hypothetical protein C6I21_05915 [Alkalicoccus urumqiensis]